MKKDLSFLTKNLIAHRGCHNINLGIPENSIIAFEEAIRKNYLIELDLHILKDGSVVVFHDDNLERMTGVNINLKDCSYEQIKNLKLLGTNNFIPLFKDVLNLVDGKVPIIIELNYDNFCGILEKEVMNILKSYTGLYAIKSFSPLSVLWMKTHFPDVPRGFLSSDLKDKSIWSNLLLKFLNVDFISYSIDSFPNKLIEQFRKNKLVLGWTIRSNSDLEKAKKYCDNFICENIL